jgi:hypothetical protein
MKAKLSAAVALSAFLFVLPSCQKDFSADEQGSLDANVEASNATANDVPETASPVHTPVVANVTSNVAGYWQTLPARYKLTTKKYPFILFIHGIGELGNSLNRVNCCGLPRHLKDKSFPAQFVVNGARYSFIIMSPQFKRRPGASDIQAIINYAKKKYRIDESRIYVTGLSMGGGSTWDYSAVYGQTAAAIVPVCGGTKPTTTKARNIASKNLPVWGIYSSGDKVVPVKWGKDFFTWIRQYNPSLGSKAKLTLWTAESHNSTWARAFNPKTKVDGRSIYEWMLLYKRGGGSTAPAPAPAPAPTPGANKLPVANAGGDRTINLASGVNRVLLNGLSSKDPDGTISTYTWKKISGPSSTTFVKSKGQAYAAHLQKGTYIYRLTVKDNRGGVDTDDMKITVTHSGSGSTGNRPPVANAGGDRTLYLSSGINRVLLNGRSSRDPDGTIRKYTWRKMSGPSSTLWVKNAAEAYAAHLVRGSYVYRLTVTDNRGSVDIDDMRITVK